MRSRFELFYRGGWAYLTVHPSNTGAAPVYVDEIQNRIRLLKMPTVDASRIREIINDASGAPEPLVEWPAGELLASEITVSVADDQMSATIEISRPKKGAAPPTVDEVVAALRDEGVVAGIDREAIARIVGDDRFGTPVPVASGRLPTHATGGEIRYHFATTRGKPYLEMEFGRINLRELQFIENTHAGATVAQILPATPAVNGVTVRGAALPANTDAPPVVLRTGKNVRTEETAAFAECEGNVRLERGAIIVEPVVTVENVNYETGNIHLDGSLVVEKEIADGFEVDVTGDLQVGHGVGKARIRAGGNVLLKTGINGNGGGRIECGGNLFVKYIESSFVETRGNLFVEEAIMHSQVSVWGNCVLNGRRAEIIASQLVVGGSLWCRKLGSINEAPTRVNVGIHPDVHAAFQVAAQEAARAQAQFETLEHQYEQLDRAVRAGHTEERILQAHSQVEQDKATATADLARARHTYHERREELEASKKSFVVVEDSMFKGAVIAFGTVEYHAPDKGARKTVFRFLDGGIIESGFNPHDAPKLRFDEDESDEEPVDPEESDQEKSVEADPTPEKGSEL